MPVSPFARGGFYEATGTLTVVLATALGGTLQIHNHSTFIPPLVHLISTSLLGGLIVASRIVPGPFVRQFPFIANPWEASLLLIGPAWIAVQIPSRSQHFVTMRIATGLVAGLAICLTGWWIQSARRRVSTTGSQLSLLRAGSLVNAISFALAVSVISSLLHAAPIRNEVTRTRPRPGLPNVILISLDTFRADHLSVYGYPKDTSPALRALAMQATVFKHALSTSDYTLPSHASMFTSLYATEHGAYYVGKDNIDRPLGSKWRTLAEILRDQGYFTVGVAANYGFVSHESGLDQGFEVFDQTQPVLLLAPLPSYYLRQSLHSVTAFLSQRYYLQRLYRTAEDINHDVFALLDQRPSNSGPLFLFINYMDAHAPYLPPPPFDRMFMDGGVESPDATNQLIRGAPEKTTKRALSPKEKTLLVSQYDGALAYDDYHLAKLFDSLKARGMYENSLIIVTSDHGEALGEKNFVGHGVSVYEDQIHVPLIVKYPGSEDGQVVEDTVSGVDVLPTVLDVIGVAEPRSAEGQSLRRVSGNDRAILSEHFVLRGKGGGQSLNGDKVDRAVMMGRFKLISSAGGDRALFDLLKDPEERANLYSSDDIAAKRLESFLAEWIKRTDIDVADEPDVGKERRELLRSLGYIR